MIRDKKSYILQGFCQGRNPVMTPAFRLFGSSLFLVYSQRSMKALNWIQGQIRDHQQQLTSLLAVGGFVLLFFSTQKHVTVIVNGQGLRISTHARTVGSLLEEMDLHPESGDEISPELDSDLSSEQVVLLTSSKSVVLDKEGDLVLARTTESLPENILVQAGLRLFPGDSIRIYGDKSPENDPSPITAGLRLRLDRGHSIRIAIDDQILQFSSSAATLGEALWDAGFEIYEGDHFEPSVDTPLEGALSISIDQSAAYSIMVDDQSVTRRGAGDTVAEILASTGISVGGLDYTIPALEVEPSSDQTIRVVRVVEEVVVELEPVEFETVYQPADHLELDTLEVLEPGTFGVQSNTVRIRYEDGEEIGRTEEGAVIAVEPKNRVIGYGTQIVVRTVDTPEGTIEYWRSIPIYATSYSPCNLGVPWCGTRTASGKAVYRGIIGVIRSWYNLMRGWSVFVPGYGPGTFEDIGGGIAGRDWIDLGFTDENFEPWHQWTTLYFLTPVPPLDSIPWILP